MLMNVRALRDWRCSEKLLALFQQHQHDHIDTPCETIFNLAFSNDVLFPLPPRFNFLSAFPRAKQVARTCKPVVVHYMNIQPWKMPMWFLKYIALGSYRYSRNYYRYVQWTPWIPFQPPTMVVVLEECMKHILRPIKRWLLGNT
jgi:lipopolysaccharide biosynthesis glycosyltransferase